MATYLNTSFNYSNIVIKQEVIDIPEYDCDESPDYDDDESPVHDGDESPVYDDDESPVYDGDESPGYNWDESPDYDSDESLIVDVETLDDDLNKSSGSNLNENYKIDLSRIKTERIEVEQGSPSILRKYLIDDQQNEAELLNRTCFVNLHRGVNQKEISSCQKCRQTANSNKQINGKKFVPSLKKQEKAPHQTDAKISQNSEILVKDSPITDKTNRTKYNLKPLHTKPNLDQKKFNCCESPKPVSRRKQNLKNLLNQPQQVRYECHVCDKTFCAKNVLKRHSLLHLEEKPYVCNVCDKAFTNRRSFRDHSISHLEKRFKCLECGKFFARRSDVKKHVLIHSGKKPFSCKICQKFFRHKSHLTRHLLIHKQEKSYFCYICCVTFPDKNQMNKHLNLHTEEKPYRCTAEHCHRSYVHKKSLDNHILTTHTTDEVPPVLCKGCYKTFLSTELWKSHLLDCVIDCIQRKDRTNVVSILKGLKGLKDT